MGANDWSSSIIKIVVNLLYTPRKLSKVGFQKGISEEKLRDIRIDP